MKITDVVPTVSEFPIEYHGERIKRDTEGVAVLERGRPITEQVYQLRKRKRINFLYLVRDKDSSEWMREGDIVNKYGKRQFRKAQRAFMASHKVREVEEALEAIRNEG